MQWRVALLAVLVALAGCGGGQTDTPTPTRPGDDVFTDRPTPDGPNLGFPDDVPESGYNETAMFLDHLETLQGQSYRLAWVRSDGETERDLATVSPNGLPRLTTAIRPTGRSVSYVASGEAYGVENVSGDVRFTRSAANNGTLIPSFAPGGAGLPEVTRALASHVVTTEFRANGTRTINGTSYTVLSANGTDAFVAAYGNRVLPHDRENATAFEGTVLVHPDGYVRSFEGHYEWPDRTLDVEITTSAVGTATVEKPDWVAEACAGAKFSPITLECQD
jgi:hypothetical protein